MADPTPFLPNEATNDTLHQEDVTIQSEHGEGSSSLNSPLWYQPIRSTKSYFSTLSEFFTWKFLSWIAVYNCCITGGVWALVMALSLPLFKEMGIDASRQQLYTTAMFSPWAMKPFIGVASDLVAINGYNKRYFAFYSILIGLSGSVILLVYFESATAAIATAQNASFVRHVADVIVICFTAISFEAATLDILGEGKYSEIMRKYPESGSSLISFKYGCFLVGSICTQAYVGPLSDTGHWNVLFWIALSLSLMPFYPTIRGWIPERYRSSDEPGMMRLCPGCLFDKGIFRQKKTPFIIITLSGLAGPVLAAITTYIDLQIGLITAVVILLLLMLSTFLVFPRVVFRVILSFMLINISAPLVGSALSYFYTADEQCLPDGPNFNYTFYITVSGMISSVVSLISVILYQTFLSSWRYQPAVIFTIVIGSLAPIVDLIIVERWNIQIGISDRVFFLLGNTIFESIITTLLSIAMSSIYAKIAPPGMESAVFAFTVGISNFCLMFAGLLGSGIIKSSGMKTVGDNCDFDNLSHIIIVWEILVPMLVGVPAAFLIPNVFQTDPLIDWEQERWYENQPDEMGSMSAHEDDSQFEPYLL